MEEIKIEINITMSSQFLAPIDNDKGGPTADTGLDVTSVGPSRMSGHHIIRQVVSHLIRFLCFVFFPKQLHNYSKNWQVFDVVWSAQYTTTIGDTSSYHYWEFNPDQSCLFYKHKINNFDILLKYSTIPRADEQPLLGAMGCAPQDIVNKITRTAKIYYVKSFLRRNQKQ